MLYFVYKVVEVIYMNKDTVYCINRDISEEEAILSLAEGWSTANPPSQDQLDRSYYKKAFESIKQGKIKWNWAAAVFGPFWFLYHKMYLYFLIAAIIPYSGIIYLLIIVTLGLAGNNIILNDIKLKVKKNYHIWKNYKGKSMVIALVVIFFEFMLKILSFNLYYWYNKHLPNTITSIIIAAGSTCIIYLFIELLTSDEKYILKAYKEYINRKDST